MKSLLEDLHIELVELTVTFLELCDIASLRLTSRTMENKASQWSFRALFRHKKVKLTTKSLKDMVRVTSQGRLGCLLQHCTITGIVLNEGTEHLPLLAEAFRNLKERSSKGWLASLCLRVEPCFKTTDVMEEIVFVSWRSIWNAALRTFNVTMAALNESQLPVHEHLDVFGSIRYCSLSCHALLAFAQKFASVHVFRSLKRLTLSLSAEPKAETEHESKAAFTETESQAQIRPNLILQGIMQLSPVMPELESLKLHWYNLGDDASTLPATSAIYQKSSTSSTFTCLRECCLRGIFVSESHLLQFLEAAHPATVTLTDVCLVSGTFASIFKYLTGPDSPVTYYHLDDIQEGGALVHFNVPGRSKFRYKSDKVGPSSLTRQISDVKDPICYRLASGRPLGSGERMNWLVSKALEFGPPRDRFFDFVKLNEQRIEPLS